VPEAVHLDANCAADQERGDGTAPVKIFKHSSEAAEISQAPWRSTRDLAALSLFIRLNSGRSGHHSDTRPGMMTPPIPARCSARICQAACAATASP
jgi:hypothetical protein